MYIFCRLPINAQGQPVGHAMMSPLLQQPTANGNIGSPVAHPWPSGYLVTSQHDTADTAPRRQFQPLKQVSSPSIELPYLDN